MVTISSQGKLDENKRQVCVKGSPENHRRAGLRGTEAHLWLRKRPKSGPKEWLMSKQSGEHGEAMAKHRKMENSSEEQEAVEVVERANHSPTPGLGKQDGKAKGQERSVPGCPLGVAGESPAEGEAKVEGSGRASGLLSGALPSRVLRVRKPPGSLLSSQLAFDKDDAVSSPPHRNDSRTSPEADGPSLSDSIDLLLDSPWSGNGSRDAAHDGPSDSRMPPSCATCATLKADLDTVREELRITQASTLYGLSGTSLQDLSEALGSIVDILNNRMSSSAMNASPKVAEIPIKPIWQERNHF